VTDCVYQVTKHGSATVTKKSVRDALDWNEDCEVSELIQRIVSKKKQQRED